MQRLCVPEFSFSPSAVPFQALWAHAASRTLPMLAAWPQPCTTPTWSQSWLFQLFCSPPCTWVCPKHITLLHTTTSSFCVLLHEASASPVTLLKMLLGCCRWIHRFFSQAVELLMQRDPKPTQKAALILHTKDFRAVEYEIQGGRKTPNTSEAQNLFQVLIRTIFKLLVTETLKKTKTIF